MVVGNFQSIYNTSVSPPLTSSAPLIGQRGVKCPRRQLPVAGPLPLLHLLPRIILLRLRSVVLLIIEAVCAISATKTDDV